uniref:Uncharacterized protein n=1 Tax=Chondria sp. (in: red algae) TaxID=1982705 RepID=A0A1Z1MRM2_9FLOR|nr:hypothetical protein [Chondria sp. (in: red algae)]
MEDNFIENTLSLYIVKAVDFKILDLNDDLNIPVFDKMA